MSADGHLVGGGYLLLLVRAAEVHGFGDHVSVLEAGAGVEENDFVGGFEVA